MRLRDLAGDEERTGSKGTCALCTSVLGDTAQTCPLLRNTIRASVCELAIVLGVAAAVHVVMGGGMLLSGAGASDGRLLRLKLPSLRLPPGPSLSLNRCWTYCAATVDLSATMPDSAACGGCRGVTHHVWGNLLSAPAALDLRQGY